MARKLDPKSKAGFVRSQPVSMSAADVVKAAKAKGVTLDVGYVYATRAAKKKRSKAARASAPARTTVLAIPSSGRKAPDGAGDAGVGGGIVDEIERMVERSVNAHLRAKLGALLS